MYMLDTTILFILIIHIIETSILITLFLKWLLGKETVSKSFYGKILVLTILILAMIYLESQIIYLISFSLLYSWIENCAPIIIFIGTFYYVKLVIISKNGFTEFFWEKIFWISVFISFLVYVQTTIFNITGYPTFIVILKVIFPLY